ncbi:hypothetical protein PIROE2DRAFT_8521 [Piromyces sp. E2]|nr:hypothetical protein PIROE2DRAFT_8521 [Piromyces sp. E2]|eukprot:OUM64681.1 hypothetical protein PIROE2DRAFT_8521 [Piromyces sp. E2]
MTAYGGDEISAIVIDIGSSLSKAGWSGEDSPKVIIPSYVGSIVESENKESKAGSDVDVTMVNTDAGNSINASSKKNNKKFIGDGQINCWRENMELKNPLKNGLSKLLI